ncbi:hypothetical protein UlMin_025471 [Ulmus minor]
MCIVVFIWQAHPLYPLFILQNKDEYHNRPMKPVSWWEDCEILGGTWLACSRGGRIALLTNVLELHTLPDARSQGDLLVLFLETPKEFAKQLVKEGHRYNGFNLVLADVSAKSMLYVSNRPKNEPIMVQEVSLGIHVLSNAKIDSHWHKCLELSFKEELGKYGDRELPAKEMIEKLMRDRVTSKIVPAIHMHLIQNMYYKLIVYQTKKIVQKGLRNTLSSKKANRQVQANNDHNVPCC